MSIFGKKTDIGKVVRDRITAFPTFKKAPVVVPPKDRACWIVCPDCKVRPHTAINGGTVEAAARDYRCALQIVSKTREKRDEALDYTIRRGQAKFEDGKYLFWLYAVNHKRTKDGPFLATLIYIFRVKHIPDKIL